MARKMIHVALHRELYKTIHDLMDTELKNESDNLLFKVHSGSKQEFYRRLLQEGVINIFKELERKKKDLK